MFSPGFCWTPIAAALCNLRRGVLVIVGLCAVTWGYLVVALPADLATPWSELRLHLILLLCACTVVSWQSVRQSLRSEEESLKLVENWNRVLSMHPLPAIVLVEDKIDFVNEQACKFLGIDREMLVGLPLSRVLPLELSRPRDVSQCQIQLDENLTLSNSPQ